MDQSALTPEELDKALASWEFPFTPKGSPTHLNLRETLDWIKGQLATEETRLKTELPTLEWIFDLVRANVKRGRFFELRRAFGERKADCLAYSQILKLLGERASLNVGVIEVLIDNTGRIVSHPANLFKPLRGKWRIVDLWYGSKDINHRRIGAMLKERGEWGIRDIDRDEFMKIEDIAGLPSQCVSALTWYTYGNIFLNRRLWDRAIECYSNAISLYPQNARFYFNRALAYEQKGDLELALKDREYALRDEASLIRVMAEEQEDITKLILLDERGINQRDQELYLLSQGYITGQKENLNELAKRFNTSAEEIKQKLEEIENLIVIG